MSSHEKVSKGTLYVLSRDSTLGTLSQNGLVTDILDAIGYFITLNIL